MQPVRSSVYGVLVLPIACLLVVASAPAYAVLQDQPQPQPQDQSLGGSSADKVRYADQYPGSDVGAKINAAIAALGGEFGTVVVSAGKHSFSTTINKPRGVILRGQGTGLAFSPDDVVQGGTILNWTSPSGNAIVIADAHGTNYESNTGLWDFTLIGPGISSDATGIWLGGDPAGVVRTNSDFADNESFVNVSIRNFARGVVWGNNAFLDRWLHCNIWGNNVGIFLLKSIVGSNESNSFVQCYIGNNTGGAVRGVGNADLHFISTSFDFNNTGTANGPPSQIAAIEALNPATFLDCHFEQWNGTFVDNGRTGSVVRIIGGDAALDSPASILDPQMFNFGGEGSDVYIAGLSVASAHKVARVVQWNSTGEAALWISGLLGNSNHEVLSPANAPVEASHFHIDSNVFGTEPSSITNATAELKRVKGNQGTPLSRKNVSLGQEWGFGASVLSILGYDPNFVVVVKAGRSVSVNPSLSVTFADGSWNTPCVPSTTRGDTNIPASATWTVSSKNAKGITLTFVGTPASGKDYTAYVICQGR